MRVFWLMYCLLLADVAVTALLRGEYVTTAFDVLTF